MRTKGPNTGLDLTAKMGGERTFAAVYVNHDHRTESGLPKQLTPNGMGGGHYYAPLTHQVVVLGVTWDCAASLFSTSSEQNHASQ